MSRPSFLVSVAVACFSYGSTSSAVAEHDHVPPSEFDFATIIVEQNATDGDTEIVIDAKPDSDDGLLRFRVRTPYGKKVVDVRSPRRVLGMRQFRFESPEPPGDAIFASYPEGEYRFVGRSIAGERFVGTATLSHQLPSPVTILWPMQDQVVPSDSLTIQWSQAMDASGILLEFENESADPEQTLLINLPSDTTSFEVPSAMLVPGAEYQIGIASVAESGNLVFTELQFSTEE